MCLRNERLPCPRVPPGPLPAHCRCPPSGNAAAPCVCARPPRVRIPAELAPRAGGSVPRLVGLARQRQGWSLEKAMDPARASGPGSWSEHVCPVSPRNVTWGLREGHRAGCSPVGLGTLIFCALCHLRNNFVMRKHCLPLGRGLLRLLSPGTSPWGLGPPRHLCQLGDARPQ